MRYILLQQISSLRRLSRCVITDRDTQTPQWLTLALRLFFFRCDTEIGYPLSYLHAVFLPGRPLLGPFCYCNVWYGFFDPRGPVHSIIFSKNMIERKKNSPEVLFINFFFSIKNSHFPIKNLPELNKKSFLLHVNFCKYFCFFVYLMRSN